MAELTIGDPACSRPISARSSTRRPATRSSSRRAHDARRPAPLPMPASAGAEHGTFFAPRAFEIDRARICSSARCSARSCTSCAGAAERLDEALDEIDATGYGLTLGIHSRIDETSAASSPPARRQHLRQPQHDRRRRRRAAVRRRAACPAPAPKRAGRAICTALRPSARSRPTPPPPAATPACCPCKTKPDPPPTLYPTPFQHGAYGALTAARRASKTQYRTRADRIPSIIFIGTLWHTSTRRDHFRTVGTSAIVPF